jgi:hypothetical protein
MRATTIILIVLLLALNLQLVFASQPVSSIRGTVIDADSRMPLVGVSIVIANSDPLNGTVSDINGEFRFEGLHVGRYDLNVFYLGYESKSVTNILLIAGKESLVKIELIESLIEIEEVTVKANHNKGEPLNQLAVISARSFTVEETKRFAGSFNDPSRMAASYAGVTGDPEGNNDIVIRGNSPRGLLWRLEGVEIPNPNHFSEEGATGGPISILNSTTLDNSDFMTGAFPAEYGNTYSGVFDIHMRKGNDEKREYTLQAGLIGFEGAAEGPFIKGKRASFLVNYRYSTLAMFKAVGIKIVGDAVPEFQDLTFNVHLPTKNAGTFSVFGLGGISMIREEETSWKNDFSTNMGVAGINHLYIISQNTYIKSGMAATVSINNWWYEELNNEEAVFLLYARENYRYITCKGHLTLNHKFNSRHQIRSGLIYNSTHFDLFHDYYDEDDSMLVRVVERDGSTGHLQAFSSWRYRIGKDLTMHAGMHFLYFNLNGNYSLEPRLGLKWQVTSTQSLSAGFGIHSRLETLTNYFAEKERKDGSIYRPNEDLSLSKARHYVIGYQNNYFPNLMIKSEIYYQDLYGVPIMKDSSSSFSALNYSYGVTNEVLINKGTGKNYGLELTVEKFFARNWYFMTTASLYQSKYKASDGMERDTRFNGNYAFNLLGGKEFSLGKGMYPWTLSTNLRFIWAGGRKCTPINLEKSREKGYTVRYEELAFSEKYDDFLRLDCKVSFIKNKKKSTHTIELDIQNATNRLNTMWDYYDEEEDRIAYGTQLGILPSIVYRVEF